jgi:DNA-binding response OmpR family regulator
LRENSILLIEDNLADVGLVREALVEHGVEGELLVIGDGDKAFRFVQGLDIQPANCPDLVILDLNLPKRSGREVLQAMRQSANCKDTTVVILSSSDAQQDRTDARVLGANLYLQKPSRLEEFLGLGAIFKALLEGLRKEGN